MSAHHSLTAEQHLTPQSDAVPAPVTTTYVGRRRALGTAPEEPPWPMYIGKRRAVLDESTRQASHVASGQSGETAPSAASALTDRSSSSLPPDIAGVSASLEPIDHTTSWASDETVVLPRVQACVGGSTSCGPPGPIRPPQHAGSHTLIAGTPGTCIHHGLYRWRDHRRCARFCCRRPCADRLDRSHERHRRRRRGTARCRQPQQ